MVRVREICNEDSEYGNVIQAYADAVFKLSPMASRRKWGFSLKEEGCDHSSFI